MGIFDLFKPKRDPPSKKGVHTRLNYHQQQSPPTNFPKTKAKWDGKETTCLGDVLELFNDIVSESKVD